MGKLRLRARLFFWVDALVRNLVKVITCLHQGFWLGILDRGSLHDLAIVRYATPNKYQDTTYNKSGLFRWEEQVLDEHLGQCSSLLVGAAGGGREVVALAARGLAVDGFDCCERLVEVNRRLVEEEGVEARVLLAEIDAVPEEFGVYDGAIIGWSGYMHICGRGSRVRFLEQLRAHLAPRGPLLLSFHTRQDNSRFFVWVRRVAGLVRRCRLNREPVELGDGLYEAFVHCFTRSELEAELDEAAFDMVHWSRVPYGHAVAVARENGIEKKERA